MINRNAPHVIYDIHYSVSQMHQVSW